MRFWWAPLSWTPLVGFCVCLFSGLYYGIHLLYRAWRQRGLSQRLAAVLADRPLVIVGNMTVGGNGKTPLLLAIALELQKQGYHPGVVSRGAYARQKGTRLVSLMRPDAADWYGDEPVMFAQSGFPVAVSRDRCAAIALLLTHDPAIDVLLSDDGLQYFPDQCGLRLCAWGPRGVGNGLLLPCGPWREPPRRMRTLHAFLCVPACFPAIASLSSLPCFRYNCVLGLPRHLLSDRCCSWSSLGHAVDVIAGIAHPPAFFDAVRAEGLTVSEHAFPDHHAFRPEDFDAFSASERPVLMTEKDAVKCRAFANDNWYYVPLSCVISVSCYEWLFERLRDVKCRT